MKTGMYFEAVNKRIVNAEGNVAVSKEEVIVRISGKTFDHKEDIKAFGFEWNGINKEWEKVVRMEDHKSFMKSVYDKFKFAASEISYTVG